ncbi:MAG: TauD/TfdA family dioxygenase [Actinomycetota bacterium]
MAGTMHGVTPATPTVLSAFRADSGASGVLLARTVPVGAVPPTPAHPDEPTGKDCVSERSLLCAARALGEPIGYAQEHGGGIVQNLIPTRGCEGRQLSTSSDVVLEWHTETAFHPHKPHYLLLLCLRGDPDAHTLLCSIADVLPHLDAATIATLREPRFRTSPDESFREPGTSGELGPPMAVLTDAEFTYDEDLMVGTDPEAQRALRRLGDVIGTQVTSIALEAGDLLVVDNHHVVHGRSPFRARFDGSDRWLQRAFVVDALPPASERDGRIITTRF